MISASDETKYMNWCVDYVWYGDWILVSRSISYHLANEAVTLSKGTAAKAGLELWSAALEADALPLGQRGGSRGSMTNLTQCNSM